MSQDLDNYERVQSDMKKQIEKFNEEIAARDNFNSELNLQIFQLSENIAKKEQ